MKLGKNQQVFLALVRAGQWTDTAVKDSWFKFHGCEQVDWNRIYELADEQSVIGLVTAGIDCLKVQKSSTSEAVEPSAS
jgi:hypothetical protein